MWKLLDKILDSVLSPISPSVRRAVNETGLGAWDRVQTRYRIEGAIVGAVLTAIVFVLAIVLAGCSAPQSFTEIKPAKTTVSNIERIKPIEPAAKQVVVTEQLDESGKPVSRTTRTIVQDQLTSREIEFNADATGASAIARGTDISGDFTGSAPSIDIPGGGGATGGDAKSKSKASTPLPEFNWLLVAGIACVLGAGTCFYFGLRRAAIVAGVVGGSLIVASFLPAWAWVMIGLAAAIAGGVYVWAEWNARKGGQYKEALRAVVGGVASLKDQSPDAYEAAKQEIGKQADPGDADTITEIKREDRL
ncbi:MAG: hypothetical protein ACK5XN_23755 [Bacteroidota bacterium]|jgi:hypothetical protein